MSLGGGGLNWKKRRPMEEAARTKLEHLGDGLYEFSGREISKILTYKNKRRNTIVCTRSRHTLEVEWHYATRVNRSLMEHQKNTSSKRHVRLNTYSKNMSATLAFAAYRSKYTADPMKGTIISTALFYSLCLLTRLLLFVATQPGQHH